MFGLDVIAVSGYLMLAGSGLVECKLPRAPQIEVYPKTAPTAYDFSKTLEELNQIQADTISPYGNHATTTFGLHEGRLLVSWKTGLGIRKWDALGLGCIYYDKIEVTIELNPVVYVVKEFIPGTCRHRAVLNHEKKHVRVDREIANKYAREIGEALREGVNKMGAVGPYRLEDLQKNQDQMTEYVNSLVRSVQARMLQEQVRRQQAVDTHEEYERVSDEIEHKCHYDIPKRLRRQLEALHGE